MVKNDRIIEFKQGINIANSCDDGFIKNYIIISDEGELGVRFKAVDYNNWSGIITFMSKEDIGKVIKFLQEVEKK